MNAMLDRLGQWIGRGVNRSPVDAAELAQFAPFRTVPPTALARMSRAAGLARVEPGLLAPELDPGRLHFLYAGSLQLQTRSGFVLTLRADAPQARYPLPLPPNLVTLYAPEPVALLSVPTTALPPGAGPVLALPAQLDDEEQSAYRQLADQVRSRDFALPSLPDLALKIGRAIDDPNNRNRDIARVIQLDPALTTRLLSIVNSPVFGGFKKIANINQAATRLGRTRVRSLVYSCLVKNIFKTHSRSLESRMRALWQRSVNVAALSFVLGRETPGIDPEQAMLAGLVHDIGAVAVIGGLNRLPVLTRRREVLDHAIRSLRVEAGLLSIDQWGLRDDLADVIRHAGDWQRIGSAVPETVDVVNLALLHALIGKPGHAGLPRIDQVPAFAKLAGGRLTPDQSLLILESAESDVREVRRLLSTG